MKLVFYSIVLNHHQAPVADEFYKILGNEYCFVELVKREGHDKGSTTDYSARPYLIRAWESEKLYAKAMELAKTAVVCVFSGVQSLPFLKVRMKQSKAKPLNSEAMNRSTDIEPFEPATPFLTFDMSERWLKQGLKNILSPAISKQFMAYWFGRWDKKPLYKLCMSAYAADDHRKLGMYKDKCFKWAYFTEVKKKNINVLETINLKPETQGNGFRIMWCARFIDWKHPEMVVELAQRLKVSSFKFQVDMYGDGPMRQKMEDLAKSFGLTVYSYRERQKLSPFRENGEEASIKFHGNVPNEEIHIAMRNSDIFLFTSDKQEGWGAVANEAMSEGCCIIGSDEIGSIPYLLGTYPQSLPKGKEDRRGLSFRSNDIDDLYEKTVWAIEHPEERMQMALNGQKTMQDVWSPENAARSLLQLIEDINDGKDTSIKEGPCSKA